LRFIANSAEEQHDPAVDTNTCGSTTSTIYRSITRAAP